MSALGKIQASLASANQELTLAFANLNFDFALFKIEAPPTYQPLGAALSLQRRSAAENGEPHVIARRLGSLFETLLPATPSLVSAYGARASEISQNPGINPLGDKDHGPFQKFVGLDGTSIWAAATSGPSAVAAHLLACMLARVWPSAEAVSIWEELVTERKKALLPENELDSIPMRDAVTAQLQITKEQLAEWDASARAWLRIADAAPSTKRQQKELMNVLSKVSIPVGSQPKVYDSVCKAWVTALSTIDKLVQGHPYSAQDGAVLVALSSWHLYPDLIVLGATSQELNLHDALIADGGALTVGLQSAGPEASNGVYWSLSLAHLRYYGSPVFSRATVDSESSRLTFPQFLLVALGSLVASWGLSASLIKDAAKLVTVMKSSISGLDNKFCGSSGFDWLRPLVSAAEHFTTASDADRDACLKLIRLGHRRQSILTRSPPDHVFYLCSLDLSCIMRSIENKIEFYLSVLQDWKRSDIPLVLRIDRKGVSHPIFVTVVQAGSSNKTSQLSYTQYVVNENQSQAILGVNFTIREYLSEDVILSASGRELVWRYPPAFEGAAYQQSPLIETGVAAKKERSRWPLRTRKDPNGSAAPKEVSSLTFEFVSGDIEVSLFCLKGQSASVKHFGDAKVDLRILTSAFSKNTISSAGLAGHFAGLEKSDNGQIMQSCHALAHAAQLYECMPGATISPKILVMHKTIAELPWAAELLAVMEENSHKSTKTSMTRAQAFSCVACFESGIIEAPTPEVLQNIMAISSGDSLYVAAQLLCDPAREIKPYEIHRVIGNIGRAGLAFLIPPQQPMVRPTDSESWKMVNHEPFDGKLENNFRSTTLHLGFTGYEVPLTLTDHGGRFVEAFFIEAVVSVHDSGRWVADLDVLSTLQHPNLFSLVQQATCVKSSPAGSIPEVEVISLDNWEELLDPPRCASVVRAHGNWQARLAAANVSLMLGHPTILFREHGCWTCAAKVMEMYQSQGTRQPLGSVNEDNHYGASNPECVFVL